MSWFNLVPPEKPPEGRRVTASRRPLQVPRDVPTVESSDDETTEGGENDVVEVPTSRRASSSVLMSSKSPYYKKGTKLQYKEGMGPEKDRGVVFVVEEHTVFGISFKGIKGRVFLAEYFELVP